VCVRYRHCERDAINVCHGAPGVSRHPGLLHLLICLRHDTKMSVKRVGRLSCNTMVGASDASRWPLCKRNVAQALMTSHIATSTPPLLSNINTTLSCNMAKILGIEANMSNFIMKCRVISTRDARKGRIALHVPGLPLSPSLLVYEKTRPCTEIRIWQLQ
jgi:hypothetical protein